MPLQVVLVPAQFPFIRSKQRKWNVIALMTWLFLPKCKSAKMQVRHLNGSSGTGIFGQQTAEETDKVKSTLPIQFDLKVIYIGNSY